MRLLSLRVCLSPVSLPFLPFLFHSLLVLCPAHHRQCRHRRGLKPTALTHNEEFAPWRYTILSHIVDIPVAPAEEQTVFQVTYSAPAPVIEYVTPSPVVEFIAPAPSVTHVSPREQYSPLPQETVEVVQIGFVKPSVSCRWFTSSFG